MEVVLEKWNTQRNQQEQLRIQNLSCLTLPDSESTAAYFIFALMVNQIVILRIRAILFKFLVNSEIYLCSQFIQKQCDDNT